MNGTQQALLTSGITLGGGLVTFLLGQVALKLLDAALELRTLIAEIDSDLTLYVLDPSLVGSDECYRIFRRHGARLNAAVSKVIGYSYFEDILRLPPRKDALKAAQKLLDIAMSASDGQTTVAPFILQDAQNDRDEIRRLLRLRSPYSDKG
jgi:hypothetical protein